MLKNAGFSSLHSSMLEATHSLTLSCIGSVKLSLFQNTASNLPESFSEVTHRAHVYCAAVIVPKPGEKIDYPMIDTHCRAHLAGFKSPKELHIVDALPRNPSGKVLKRILRDQLVSKNN